AAPRTRVGAVPRTGARCIKDRLSMHSSFWDSITALTGDQHQRTACDKRRVGTYDRQDKTCSESAHRQTVATDSLSKHEVVRNFKGEHA
ncbi:MAG: hypothetical protein QOF74_5458, partial [Caballeronia mineralivorans]|nr:hypothetical protein [Caballeronia mineralivorans]